MKQIPSCSLLIATYNWPDALEVCVRSVFRQTVLPKEILICDDGSGSATKSLVEELRKMSSVPILHIWHEDNGFQLSIIRNKGIAVASGEYIIQVDGDLILHKNFIEDHLANAIEGVFYSGTRFYLSPERSKRILDKLFTRLPIYLKFAKNIWAQFRVPFLQKLLSARGKKIQHYVMGCNLGMWHKDLIAVNGYDESFTGWGSEDHDLAIRLVNHGIEWRLLRFGGIQFHIYHPENPRSYAGENANRALEHLQGNITHIEKGVDQYFNNPALLTT